MGTITITADRYYPGGGRATNRNSGGINWTTTSTTDRASQIEAIEQGIQDLQQAMEDGRQQIREGNAERALTETSPSTAETLAAIARNVPRIPAILLGLVLGANTANAPEIEP
jgi:isopentenyl diphosphate isomerase/L-lactate dehydrogenase-like FMN-dependent dehydrogenase